MKLLKFFAIEFIMILALFALEQANINPAKWSYEARFYAAGFTAALWLATFYVKYVDGDDDEKKQLINENKIDESERL